MNGKSTCHPKKIMSNLLSLFVLAMVWPLPFSLLPNDDRNHDDYGGQSKYAIRWAPTSSKLAHNPYK